MINTKAYEENQYKLQIQQNIISADTLGSDKFDTEYKVMSPIHYSKRSSLESHADPNSPLKNVFFDKRKIQKKTDKINPELKIALRNAKEQAPATAAKPQ